MIICVSMEEGMRRRDGWIEKDMSELLKFWHISDDAREVIVYCVQWCFVCKGEVNRDIILT